MYKDWKETGLDISPVKKQGKVICPHCSDRRKKSFDPCVSVNLDKGVFFCHHCGWKGAVGSSQETQLKQRFTPAIKPNYNENLWELSEEVIDWFAGRGISETTLRVNKIGSRIGYLRPSMETGDKYPIISFPFVKDDVVNVQFRTLDKRFMLVPKAEICFWGLNNLYENGVLATRKLFITEGMIDALSLYEVGFRYAISVPSGSPFEEEGRPFATPDLKYLDDPDFTRIVNQVDEVVFVTDNDYKGKRLRDALADRIGIEKSFYVTYPEGCKDANDVLQLGEDELIKVLLNQRPLMSGLVSVKDVNLLDYYKKGLEGGMVCGLPALDQIYTLSPPYLTTITGVPSAGKSLVIDNLAVGYANEYEIHTAYFSPETKPVEYHISRLATIYTGQEFGTPDEKDRMSWELFKESQEWIDKHFSFIQPRQNTLKDILGLAKLSILQHGTKLLVIDPYSRVTIEGKDEKDFIRAFLNEVGEFASKHNIAIWIVAHPTKVERFGKTKSATEVKEYPVITPYDILGSSHWFNSSDFILSVWRSVNKSNMNTKIYCLKSKYKHLAKEYEVADLYYNPKNDRLT